MFINVHCELVSDKSRVLKIRGENLLNLDIETFDNLKKFMSLNSNKQEYIDTFSLRYNSKLDYARNSRFYEKRKWPESYNKVLNIFYSSIESKIHKIEA